MVNSKKSAAEQHKFSLKSFIFQIYMTVLSIPMLQMNWLFSSDTDNLSNTVSLGVWIDSFCNEVSSTTTILAMWCS